jgi:uncharacterized membrane protein YdjX (TVP38/TMEM64 family)
MTQTANKGASMEMFLGILLMLSALTGASLIAIFFFRKMFQSHHHGPVYSPTSNRISPEHSHGNSEPHA